MNNVATLPSTTPAVADDAALCKSAMPRGDVVITPKVSAAPAPAGPTASDEALALGAAAAFVVPDNEVEETRVFNDDSNKPEEFDGSKADRDMRQAIAWLKEQPSDVIDAVRAVLRSYEPKLYQRTTSSNVPFWRSVLADLVEKQQAGASAAAADGDADVDDDDEGTVLYDEPFFVVDLARTIVQMAKFRRNLPRVTPFYAVKCNNSLPMIAMIAALGGGFDCASKGEFRTVLDGKFATTEKIIFAHPCKMENNIIAARRRGVTLTTFDNEEELAKLQRLMPNARAVLRISTDDSAAQCQLSSKFGCPMEQTTGCLERAKELGIAVVGVSFHCGSGNSSPAAYFRALHDARQVFDAATALGFEMSLLDIGGGFPGSEPKPDPETGAVSMSFEEICAVIRPEIDRLFPEEAGIKVIAEPGRYFAESTYAIAMNIHSMRRMPTGREGALEYQYYTSDGVYQSFNCMLYDHAKPEVHVLKPDQEAAFRPTTIFGPTCDGIDFIMKGQQFPALDVGDWIFVPDFGAYTVAAGSSFNGFATRRAEFISSLDINDL